MKARDAMGTRGHPPISTYDLTSIGLAGFVTNKGWTEIHNPGSGSLALRMFTINNCGGKAGKGQEETEDLEEISEIGEFKTALRVLAPAMRFVHPWNHSVDALEGFFHQTNYCYSDLEGLERKAALLTGFTDYVLRENSNR